MLSRFVTKIQYSRGAHPTPPYNKFPKNSFYSRRFRPFQIISLFLVNMISENLPGNQEKKRGHEKKRTRLLFFFLKNGQKPTRVFMRNKDITWCGLNILCQQSFNFDLDKQVTTMVISLNSIQKRPSVPENHGSFFMRMASCRLR